MTLFYLPQILEPDLWLLPPVDEGLVPHNAHHVADHEGEHEVLVDAEAVAFQ